MKIVTWNCNGALRKKTEELETLAADVYVVQECEDPASSTSTFRSWAGDYLWTGTSRHKGLGVFAKNGHVVRATHWHGSFVQAGVENSSPASMWTTSDLKLFLPFTVNGEYQVLGVWTKADNSEVFSYIGQLWKYLQIHKRQLHKIKQFFLEISTAIESGTNQTAGGIIQMWSKSWRPLGCEASITNTRASLKEKNPSRPSFSNGTRARLITSIMFLHLTTYCRMAKLQLDKKINGSALVTTCPSR